MGNRRSFTLKIAWRNGVVTVGLLLPNFVACSFLSRFKQLLFTVLFFIYLFIFRPPFFPEHLSAAFPFMEKEGKEDLLKFENLQNEKRFFDKIKCIIHDF